MGCAGIKICLILCRLDSASGQSFSLGKTRDRFAGSRFRSLGMGEGAIISSGKEEEAEDQVCQIQSSRITKNGVEQQ